MTKQQVKTALFEAWLTIWIGAAGILLTTGLGWWALAVASAVLGLWTWLTVSGGLKRYLPGEPECPLDKDSFVIIDDAAYGQLVMPTLCGAGIGSLLFGIMYGLALELGFAATVALVLIIAMATFVSPVIGTLMAVSRGISKSEARFTSED